jgi:glycosyltransferase involved in cell wall biosynthesis
VAVKRVLIVTYYWPPSGGGGVQRWLKFVKYLRDFGWEPIIYTPKNPDFELQDESLLDDVPKGIEVLKNTIWEPFGLYKLLFGKKAVQKQGVVANSSGSFFSKLAIGLRGNYFIPDARVFWVRTSVNYLTRYLKSHKIDALVTTGPPHSLHLIGLEIKNRLGIKWVADFRDPWSKWDVLDQLNLTRRARKNHQNLEHSVLTGADLILTVSPSLKSSLEEMGSNKTTVITNGYDLEPVDDIQVLPEKFRISHIGLLNKGRNPEMLWAVLAELVEDIPGFGDDLEIYLSGTIEEEVLTSIRKYEDLQEHYVNAGYLSHNEVKEAHLQSAILLLLVNNTDNGKWILPGKMYEYIAHNRPILSLGMKNSDADNLLKDVGFEGCIEYDDKERIKSFIVSVYNAFKNGSISQNTGNVEKYHRRELTKSLAACLDQL